MHDDRRTSLPDRLRDDQRRLLDRVYRKLRIEMVSCWWWHVDRSWRMLPRRLPDDFFFIPMAGRLQAQVGEHRELLLPGQCMFVREGQLHSGSVGEGNQQLQLVAIHAHLMPQWGGSIAQLVDRPFQSLPDLAASTERLARLTHLMNHAPRLGQTLGEQMVRDWLAFWSTEPGTPTTAKEQDDPRIAEAVQIIQQRYDQPLTVASLAEQVHLGEVQFRKLFKRITGQSPKAYLAQYRLRQAARQLVSTHATAKEIAYATGFSDPHYFHLSFRKQFGCTPMQYRKRSQTAV